MEHQISPPEPDRMTLLAQTVACTVRPLEFVDTDHISLPLLDPHQLKRLAGRPGFRAPLNRSVSRKLGLHTLAFSNDWIQRIGAMDDDLNLVLQLVHGPQETVIFLARHCAAIQLSAKIRACVQKAERRRMERLLGQEAILAAVREAPVFFSSLCGLANAVRLEDGSRTPSSDETRAEADSPGGAEHPVIQEGLATILALVNGIDACFATLFSLRFPAITGVARTGLSARQTNELKQLFRRRGLKW